MFTTTVESLLRQSEFDREKVDYVSDIVELDDKRVDVHVPYPKWKTALNYKTAKRFTTQLLLSHIRNCFIAELCDCAR
jgi:hypothetical protein